MESDTPNTDWVLSLLCGLASMEALMNVAERIAGKQLRPHQELQALMSAVGNDTFMEAAEKVGKVVDGSGREEAAEHARRLLREGSSPSEKPHVCARYLRGLTAGLSPKAAYEEAHLEREE
jgi:hypothetical protein